MQQVSTIGTVSFNQASRDTNDISSNFTLIELGTVISGADLKPNPTEPNLTALTCVACRRFRKNGNETFSVRTKLVAPDQPITSVTEPE